MSELTEMANSYIENCYGISYSEETALQPVNYKDIYNAFIYAFKQGQKVPQNNSNKSSSTFYKSDAKEEKISDLEYDVWSLGKINQELQNGWINTHTFNDIIRKKCDKLEKENAELKKKILSYEDVIDEQTSLNCQLMEENEELQQKYLESDYEKAKWELKE